MQVFTPTDFIAAKHINTKSAVFAVFAFVFFTSIAFAQQLTPGYNTKIPEHIMTPDRVETRIGTLEFFDGIPTKETAASCHKSRSRCSLRRPA